MRPTMYNSKRFTNDGTCGALLYKVKKIMALDQAKVTPEERLAILRMLQKIERNRKVLLWMERNMYHQMLDKIERSARAR